MSLTYLRHPPFHDPFWLSNMCEAQALASCTVDAARPFSVGVGNLKGFKDVLAENGSSQGQNLALTVLFVPTSPLFHPRLRNVSVDLGYPTCVRPGFLSAALLTILRRNPSMSTSYAPSRT